ncbi:hypothetical protein [Sphingosinicella sp. LY1275]|uniref:hypothetical protein n=1 Tax=Sphingosinicella sp. LY1275 TaxID=3095379 RepID=UPI002ADEEE14|nr:hypothetical protein [Sphingosinicella sp. LY1275]MEA1015474.1 hypothetical protein [Sphingosinicella sp. LY1275]
MRLHFALLPLLALAACGEGVKDDHFANAIDTTRPESPAVNIEAVPVRIGEQGSSFAACGAFGTTRHLKAGQALPVRVAPFDGAEEVGEIAAAGRFFVCTRSHDQRWMGVVYDNGGTLDERCGVLSPVSARRAYDGPCGSGWVSSAFVKLVAG